MADSPRIVVSGYYGFNNTGDEAVLAGMAESFKETGGDVRLTVLSANPEDTLNRHGLPAVDRMNMKAVRAAIADSDLFLSGGGSLLQDTTSLRSVLYYLWVTRMALSARKPVMFYAQGIGPLKRRASRILTRMIADRVQLITVRDAESAQLLREIGVRRPQAEVTADPAFALTAASIERADQILAESGVSGDSPLIGIAPRPWHHPRPTVEDYSDVARLLNADFGARIVLLPMQAPGDLLLCEKIASRIPEITRVVRNPISPQEAVAVISRMSVLLAMRLHALIFAATSATPIVAISYDPKVRSLMGLLGQPGRCVDVESFETNGVVELVLSTLNHAESTRDELASRAESLRVLALRNARLARSLVQSA